MRIFIDEFEEQRYMYTHRELGVMIKGMLEFQDPEQFDCVSYNASDGTMFADNPFEHRLVATIAPTELIEKFKRNEKISIPEFEHV